MRQTHCTISSGKQSIRKKIREVYSSQLIADSGGAAEVDLNTACISCPISLFHSHLRDCPTSFIRLCSYKREFITSALRFSKSEDTICQYILYLSYCINTHPRSIMGYRFLGCECTYGYTRMNVSWLLNQYVCTHFFHRSLEILCRFEIFVHRDNNMFL
jgi:hypothetical protein